MARRRAHTHTAPPVEKQREGSAAGEQSQPGCAEMVGPERDCPASCDMPPAPLSVLLSSVQLQEEGAVLRHVSRQGTDVAAPRQKDARRAEGSICTAGLRNPARWLAQHPEVARSVGQALLAARAKDPALRSLHLAGGENPGRVPPPAESIAAARASVAAAVGLQRGEAEGHHSASPWRFNLFRACLALMRDSDHAVVDWLERGAPMGISLPIEPGGHFPRLVEGDVLATEELPVPQEEDLNHQSFYRSFDG